MLEGAEGLEGCEGVEGHTLKPADGARGNGYASAESGSEAFDEVGVPALAGGYGSDIALDGGLLVEPVEERGRWRRRGGQMLSE